MDYEIMDHDRRRFPMGLTVIEEGIHVCVAATGENCSLVLYKKGDAEPCKVIPLPSENRLGDVWSVSIEGRGFKELEYCFEIDGELVSDPCGRCFSGNYHFGDIQNVHSVKRAGIVAEEFDWEGDKPLGIPYHEMIVYHAHVRGLTKHSTSKVLHKGTFQGIAEKIPYMKELGITTVEIMPPAEFEEVMMTGGMDGNPYGKPQPTGKINYWGYCEEYLFAPKFSYSSREHKNPVCEFKELVKTMHRAGLELIIELFFTGKENPSMVMDALHHWVWEYHVDGIHVIGNVPAAMIGQDAYLSRTKLFAASWDGIDAGKHKHLAEYNDGFLIDMRRLLKGDEDQMNGLIFRSRRNPKDYAVINYIANTNGFTMQDMVSYDRKHNEANGEGNQDGNDYNFSWNCGKEGPTKKKKIVELRKKQIRNALLLVFLSQGVPLILAGDEFGNSKQGNNNSYCQDNELSWLNWNQLKTNQEMYDFTRSLIAFRKNHPVLHMEQEPLIMDYLSCGYPDVSYHGVRAWCPEFENFRRQLGIMYCGEYGKKPDGSTDDYFFIAYNMHWEPHEFALPNIPKNRQWYVAINTAEKTVNGVYPEGEELLVETQKRFMVLARTIVVFIGKVSSKIADVPVVQKAEAVVEKSEEVQPNKICNKEKL